MAANSTIEWTESTWNPVTGCTKISEGCAHCYAERMALRLKAMGQKNYVKQVFEIMNNAYRHRFQILTKRAERLADLAPSLNWTENIRMGVTVESAAYLYRLEYLCNVSAAVRFLSLEPLLGPIPDMDLTKIDWVIVGGESGPGARPMNKSWVIDIQQQCHEAKVPFFFKQWGGVNKKKSGRLLDGTIYSQMPTSDSGIYRPNYALNLQ